MKIGILISGRGSNMTAIIEAVQSGRIPNCSVRIVISDKKTAQGLEKARMLGVETVVVPRNGRSREEHDAEIVGELKKRGVELVCLAGYMRLLSKDFVRSFPNKIVNIHPSLLPAFPGLDAQKQAFDYGVKVSGCTVHFVDEFLDHGAIIAQKSVEVLDDDTAETLQKRILGEEHRLYIEALKKLAAGNYEIEGRRVVRKVVNFDRLAEKAFAGNAAIDNKNELWGNAFALLKWNFIARGEMPNLRPYIASNPSVAGGKNMIYAFTDTDRLQRYVKENNLTGNSGDSFLISIPTVKVVEYLEKFVSQDVHGVWFNADSESYGFFSPLVQLRQIKNYLEKIGWKR